MDLVTTLKYIVNLLLSQYRSSDPKTEILLLLLSVLTIWTEFGSYKLILALASAGDEDKVGAQHEALHRGRGPGRNSSFMKKTQLLNLTELQVYQQLFAIIEHEHFCFPIG